jgi:pimeloyl-ACP methyl ester carboxylesterase
VLCELEALRDGPPVEAMLMQNANSAIVAPDTAKVPEASAEDLFPAGRSSSSPLTAHYADIVLPATMFVEHDDIYYGLGHTHLTFGPKLVDPPGEARPQQLHRARTGRLLGAKHASFAMTDLGAAGSRAPPRRHGELHGHGAGRLGRSRLAVRARAFPHWLPASRRQIPLKPDWRRVGPDHEVMPAIADWSDRYEQADARHPYKLVCPPARHFLNTTFSETPTSIAKERAPCVRIHPDAAAREGLSEGSRVRIGNHRGSVLLMATLDEGQQAATLIVEGIWPAHAFEEKRAINTLIGDDPVPPNGGAVFHERSVAAAGRRAKIETPRALHEDQAHRACCHRREEHGEGAIFEDKLGLPFEYTRIAAEHQARYVSRRPDLHRAVESDRADSETSKWIDAHGEGLFHICLRSRISTAPDELKAKGVKLIDDKPRIGHANSRIASIRNRPPTPIEPRVHPRMPERTPRPNEPNHIKPTDPAHALSHHRRQRQLYYEDTGAGTPVACARVRRHCRREPQVRLRAAIDASHARGWTPSEVPQDVAAYPRPAPATISSVLDHLKIGMAHVVGLSMEVLPRCTSFPVPRALSLVVAGVGYGAEKDQQAKFRSEVEVVAKTLKDEGMQAFAGKYAYGPTRVQFADKDPRGLPSLKELGEHRQGAANTQLGIQRSVLNLRSEPQLKTLTVPTLILNGDEDWPCLLPGVFMKRMILRFPQLIPNSGHTINIEEPDAFNAALAAFWAQVDGRAHAISRREPEHHRHDEAAPAAGLPGASPGSAARSSVADCVHSTNANSMVRKIGHR